MTAATTQRARGARSLKARPEAQPPADRLGSFPPPTEWSEKLAIDNQGLSRTMALRMARVTRMDLESLQAVADLGLLKGCRLYDPARINPGNGLPYRLSTCVVPYIRGAMLHYLRDKGFTSGVKFPDRWRDVAPKARRMASEGVALEVIGEAIGLPACEVEEMLEAQGTTALFDPEVYDSRQGAPDPLDAVEEHAELADAAAIADQAFAAMSWADQQMLVKGWQAPRGPRLGHLQAGQFLRRARRILSGLAVDAPQSQATLAIDLATASTSAPGATEQRIHGSRQILETAVQMGLFSAHPDQSGKASAADIGSAGESDSEDQPPD